MTHARTRLGILAGSLGLAISTTTLIGSLAAPADAMAAPVAVPCVTTAQGPVPAVRRHADTSPVTAADLSALPSTQALQAGVQARSAQRVDTLSAAERLPAQVVVPTYVHVIRGSHAGEKIFSKAKVDQMMVILRRGFAGLQQDWARRTRYTFHLKGLTYTKNDRWFHASNFNAADQQAKRALHRGGKNALNIFVNGAGSATSPVLGWSRFPWQAHSYPRLDSVSVNFRSMPGGSAKGYNLGDTVIHETGHWMGLFHTFQGGCSGQGDLVADTAPEASASYYCEIGRDTCAGGAKDDIQNFMDYSLDSCMRYFRLGQIQRMDRAWATWRQP